MFKLEYRLELLIQEECKKLIRRYHQYHNYLHLEHKRNEERLIINSDKIIHKPDYWNIDSKFNPFYVKRKSKSIAKSIAKAIETRIYKPHPPFVRKIQKSDGGCREVSIYTIPDSVVSKLFYNRLLQKNKHRFSSFSYAYRNDRNVHFAIQDVSVSLKENSRAFISEFDFSDFFGSISHQYLHDQYDKNGFLIGEEDKYVINAFLETRERGIPQGTSISLFLANMVCWKLDRSFEKAGLKFARYADDTIVWSDSYSSICRSFELISDFSNEAGVKVNTKKSDGISLLIKGDMPAEIHSKSAFNFLGYSIAVDKVSIKPNSVNKIKKQISYLLYKNLIQPLKQTPVNARLLPKPHGDKALLIALAQIRRYMYGGLSTQDLIDFLNGGSGRIYFKGIMSFYPLIDDEKQLKELDGWLVSTVYRVIECRAKLVASKTLVTYSCFPRGIPKNRFAIRMRRKRIMGLTLLEIPSFTLVYKVIKRGVTEIGIEKVMHPRSLDYDYSS
ncbi:RNA-dependent DNA polymerase [Aquitalea sp. FJL05]|uniref:reverse transcriptase domain-containing protein n=1 Tax=Aquitalea sp. FJL05 TaxID=2153366 RepID=UPI000F5912C4|nr:reverse transcriptase domain-containing protein [Aquitalea sp. FJL05]RQO72985.1 RNA-dependent DNA polymerase [Aquitalea sp. FJL05]